ncbi:MAG: alpha/beta hydrolase [Burkholderiaceae bacterium]|nr:alpha/beta hydrolase [Burkholderiaceae bacterium]
MLILKRLLQVLFALVLLCFIAVVTFMYVEPEKATSMAVDAERQRSGLVRKEITSSDGLHYVYLEGGEGDPLILLHGFGADKDHFTRVARWLTPHYRVIIPDLIGFGESDHPADIDYTAHAQAQRLQLLAQSLKLNKFDLGGSSMGGQIAMAWAVQHPDAVRSLWLIDSAGIWSAPKSELARIVLSDAGNPLIAHTEDEFEATFHFVMEDPPFIPRAMLNVMAREPIKYAKLHQQIFDDISTESVEEDVTGLPTPTFILWGAHDKAIDVRTADVLSGLLPNSEVDVLKGIGHLPMLEAPMRSAEDYLSFRARQYKSIVSK